MLHLEKDIEQLKSMVTELATSPSPSAPLQREEGDNDLTDELIRAMHDLVAGGVEKKFARQIVRQAAFIKAGKALPPYIIFGFLDVNIPGGEHFRQIHLRQPFAQALGFYHGSRGKRPAGAGHALVLYRGGSIDLSLYEVTDHHTLILCRYHRGGK